MLRLISLFLAVLALSTTAAFAADDTAGVSFAPVLNYLIEAVAAGIAALAAWAINKYAGSYLSESSRQSLIKHIDNAIDYGVEKAKERGLTIGTVDFKNATVNHAVEFVVQIASSDLVKLNLSPDKLRTWIEGELAPATP